MARYSVKVVAGDESTGGPKRPVRAFVSYAHDSAEHQEAVRALWSFLRASGVDARLDLSAAEEPRDWSIWMSDQIRDCEFVLVIGSPEYRRRAEARAHNDEGRGVQWEAALIRNVLYSDPKGSRARILPVILPGRGIEDLPDWLTPATSTVYRVDDFSVIGAESLYRVLTRQPRALEPPLGPVQILPPDEPWRRLAALEPKLDIAFACDPKDMRETLLRRSVVTLDDMPVIIGLPPELRRQGLRFLKAMWQGPRPVTKLVASNNSKIDYSNVRIEIVTSKPYEVFTIKHSDGRIERIEEYMTFAEGSTSWEVGSLLRGKKAEAELVTHQQRGTPTTFRITADHAGQTGYCTRILGEPEA
jgi:hypothetical protein